jgi:predicted Zn-dependent protease
MNYSINDRSEKRKLTRRDFIWLTSVTTAGVLTGCAVNPVTGKRQFMLMTEQDEIQIDQSYAPHQFSADYGPIQDANLNHYITEVGQKLAEKSHRPQMPYSFRVVNATYVNAYAFPGGSIAVTRGILLSLENEAELAALLGHEIGHVNARHTASRMTTNMLLGGAVALGTILVATKDEKAAPWVAGLGGLGAGLLLAHYSREDEREADSLGMTYMTRGEYNPQGMVGLMDMLKSLSTRKPNAIEIMFATHPMSDERYETAIQEADSKYPGFASKPVYRDRFMDKTAKLRRIKGAIEVMQNGEKEMAYEKYSSAKTHFENALRKAPKDYAGLVMMAKCQIALDDPHEAFKFAYLAQQTNPREAQAVHVAGIAKMMQDRWDEAYQQFDNYEKMMPGNPSTIFLKGFCQEGMQHRDEAAKEYIRFLNQVSEGDQADHARQRLTEWGYIQSQQQ